MSNSFSCASAHPLRNAPLFRMAALAMLGLAAVPAQAQILTVSGNDTITVSGAGTVGIQHGLPLANTTSSYSTSSPFSAAVGVGTSGIGAFTLTDGGSISSTGEGGRGLAVDSQGLVTLSGGSISSTGLSGAGLYTLGTGPIIITLGIISAGQSGTGLDDSGAGLVTIYGGKISAGDHGKGLAVYGGSTVTLSGGDISVGTGGFGLFNHLGTINLFSQGGSPFLVDGVPTNNVSLTGSYTSGLDTISGVLANGDILDTTFVSEGATGSAMMASGLFSSSAGSFSGINLNVGTPPALPVPEASTTISLGLLLTLGMGGVLAARKKAGRA